MIPKISSKHYQLACFSARDENSITLKFSLIITFPRTSGTIKTALSPLIPIQNYYLSKRNKLPKLSPTDSPHPHNKRTSKPPPHRPRGIANMFSKDKHIYSHVYTEFFINCLSQDNLQMSHRGIPMEEPNNLQSNWLWQVQTTKVMEKTLSQGSI